MFRTRMRKIFRDVWARKVRTLLVSVSIFIGVFGVVALSSAGEILVRQLEKDLQTDKLAMLRTAIIANRDMAIDNEALLNDLRDLPNVTTVEARAVYPLQWRLPDEPRFREGAVATGSSPFEQWQLEPPRLLEGRFPEATDDRETIELAVDRRLADEFGVGIGDQVVLRVLGGNGTDTATGEIVGIVFQAYGFSSNQGFVDPQTLTLMAYDDAQYVAAFRGYSAIYARYTDFPTAEAEQSAFIRQVGQGGYIPTFTSVLDPAENPDIESSRTTSRLLVILAMAALVVSGFLIVNVINAIVVEQRRQIGLMKALGATTFDKFYIYIGTAFVYGLLGVIPGVLLGIPAGYFFAQGLAQQSQTIIEEFGISVTGIILGIVVGLAIPVLAAIIPVFNGTRIKILDAMTDFGIDASFGETRLERWIGNLPLPISLRQATRNAYQKKFRLALTGLTLTLASAAFMGVFAVFASLTTFVDNTFEALGSEITIVPNSGQDFEAIENLLESNVDGIESINPAASLAIEIEGYDPAPVQAGPPGLFVQGYNTENPELVSLELDSGEGWKNDPQRSGVVISSTIADATGKQAGDEMVLIGAGNQQAFEIIGIINFPIDAVWMRWSELAVFGGLVDAAGNPYPNTIDITLTDEDATGREVDDKINEINEVLLGAGISSNINNQVALAEIITTIVVAFGVILSVAALLIALVGSVGLLTSLSMSVFERQKEIGVMRSVGATSPTIALQFLTEGLIVGITAWIISVPLSYAFGQVLIANLPFGGDYEIDFPIIALVVGLVGMLVIVTLASVLPSIAAARKTVSDILRYQ